MKNFCACDRICEPVLEGTSCSIFFQFLPWMYSPRLRERVPYRKLRCSYLVHLPLCLLLVLGLSYMELYLFLTTFAF